MTYAEAIAELRSLSAQFVDKLDNGFARMADAIETEHRRLVARREALEHLVVRGGLVPGIEPSCRCDRCRETAKMMAEAGLMFTISDRWWEK